jgi:hypothetical protein
MVSLSYYESNGALFIQKGPVVHNVDSVLARFPKIPCNGDSAIIRHDGSPSFEVPGTTPGRSAKQLLAMKTVLQSSEPPFAK